MVAQAIHCPRCGAGLHVDRKPNGIFWTCPSCTGLALNLAVLRRCLPDDQVKHFWQRLQTATRSSDPCPSCAQALGRFTLDVGERTLELDVCKTCQLVWFDKGEFAALPENIVEAEVFSPETEQRLNLLKLQHQMEMQGQLTQEADRVAYWTDVACGVFGLLLRVFLRV